MEYLERHKKGDILNLLFDEFVEANLVQPTFVTDHPIEVSPLTKKKPDDPGYVQRFELYITGREMANAYSELNDPIDQRQRFEAQEKLKLLGDEEANSIDEDFLNALMIAMPYGGICWVTAGFLLMHIFAVSPEMTLITAIFLLVTALLYYGFQPGDSYLLILTPMMFAFRIPYVIPLLVGLGGKLVSVVPVSCGIVLYYIFSYIKQNAAPLTHEILFPDAGEFSDLRDKGGAHDGYADL